MIIKSKNNMPNIQSAKKALRQNVKRKLKNREIKKGLKVLVKKVKLLISQKKREEAQKLLPSLYKTLDKSAKANIIKKNTADRRKSRIAKSVNSCDK